MFDNLRPGAYQSRQEPTNCQFVDLTLTWKVPKTKNESYNPNAVPAGGSKQAFLKSGHNSLDLKRQYDFQSKVNCLQNSLTLQYEKEPTHHKKRQRSAENSYKHLQTSLDNMFNRKN